MAAASAISATLYVWPGSPTPTVPYTNWATAAQTIQDAIDASQAGDLVLATNGVYKAGGRAVYGLMTNRVVIDRAITVQSVNGPEVTSIDGGGSTRCVYLGTNAVLSGFKLQNGNTRNVGDALRELSGGGAWCAVNAVLTNCVLANNKAFLNGGAVCYGTLWNCTLQSNSAANSGGGAFRSSLNNCTLNGNVLTGSGAAGAGAYYGTLNNCYVTGNVVSGLNGFGGGAYYSSLTGCTVQGNVVSGSSGTGGGVYGGTVINSIVYYNTATNGSEYAEASVNYSCTTPLPAGTGNLASSPGFTDNGLAYPRLSASSPCRDAGNDASVQPGATDRDGRARIAGAHVDMGAYEYSAAPMLMWASPSFTNGLGQTANFAVNVEGASPMTFQWYKVSSGTLLDNATNSLLVLSNCAWSDAGDFQCVAANAFGSVTSQVINLTMTSFDLFGLVAYYPFAGSAKDQSGRGNHGTVSGAQLTADRFYRAESAYAFDGSSYIRFDSPPLTQTDNLTLSAWLCPSSLNQSGLAVLAGSDDGSRSTGYAFGVAGGSSGGNGSALVALVGGKGWVDSGYSFTSVSQWHHIVMLRDSGTLKFYVDGVQTTNTSTWTALAPEAFRLGSEMGLRYYRGALDEVRVYNRALSAAEVQQLYDLESSSLPFIQNQPASVIAWLGSNVTFSIVAGGYSPNFYQWYGNNAVLVDQTNNTLLLPNVQSPQAGNYWVVVSNRLGCVTSSVVTLTLSSDPAYEGLVAYYPFNGTAGDASGHGFAGVVSGATLTADRFGRPGQAYNFKGADSILVDSTPLQQVDNWTMMAWLRPNTLNQCGFAVMCGVDSGNLNNGFGFGLASSGGGTGNRLFALLAGMGWLDGGYTFDSTNRWHQVAMLRENGKLKFYVDGVQTTNTYSTFVKMPTGFRLGSVPGQDRWYNGALDEVRLYNRALSSEEVRHCYALDMENPPIITSQPQSRLVYNGSSASFNVSVFSYQPAFQWYGASSTNGPWAAIDGATDSLLTMTNCQLSQNGSACFVVASNAFGVVTSQVAVLSVVTFDTYGLAAYYPFNGDATDVSGHGIHGTPCGATLAPDRYGHGDSAYTFNGASNYLSFSNVPLRQVDNWAISAWVRPASLSQVGLAVMVGFDSGVAGAGGTGSSGGGTWSWEGGVGGIQIFYPPLVQPPLIQPPTPYLWPVVGGMVSSDYTSLSYSNALIVPQTGTANDGFGFGLCAGSDSPGNRLCALLGGIGWVDSGYAFTSTNLWHQVVLLREGGVLKFYVDGVQTTNTATTTPILPSAFSIGSGSGTRFLKGSVDDVRIYANALSAQEVQQLFTQESQSAPVFAGQPQDQVVCAGAATYLFCEAWGTSPIGCQWYEAVAGSANWTVIDGATNRFLVLPNCQPEQNGQSFCVVLTNMYGAATSQVARLSVTNVRSYGLVAYYPFDGNALDASGNGNDGSVAGASLSADRLGQATSAYHFNGTNQYLGFDFPPLTQVDDWTISAWLRPDATTQREAVAVLVGFDNGSAASGYGFGIAGGGSGGTGDKLCGFFPGVSWVDSGFGFGETNFWHHVAMVRQQGVVRFYVDGMLAPNYSTYTPSAPAGFRIGSTMGQRYFKGAIDEVRVYNRALSGSDVAALVNSDLEVAPMLLTQPASQVTASGSSAKFNALVWGQAPLAYQWYQQPQAGGPWLALSGATNAILQLTNCQPAQDQSAFCLVVTNRLGAVTSQWATLSVVRFDLYGLAAYYPFNANAKDASGHGFDGTVVGAKSGADRFGGANGAYWFNGTDNYIGFDSVPLTNADNWTISAWLCPGSLSQFGLAVLVGMDNGGYSTGYGFGVGNFAGDRLCGLAGGAGWVNSGYSFTSTNEWHHVVMLRDAGTLKFFVDGVQTSGTSTSTPLPPTSFRLGSEMGLRFYRGALDEVRLYSRAFSARDVEQLYALESQSAPIIISELADQAVHVGFNAFFSFGVSGTAPLAYQWSQRPPGGGPWTPVEGATNATLQVANCQLSWSGASYQLVVSNSLGVVTSRVATLTVSSIPAPAIVAQPLPAKSIIGGSAAFSVSVQSPVLVAYQWYFQSNQIAGATNAALNLSNLGPEQFGPYFVVAANSAGSVTSQVANLAQMTFDEYGLVAYYPFNGGAQDASGYGNNGSVYGASLTADRFGNPQLAYSFNGAGNTISFNGTPLTNTDNWTVSAWLRPASLSQQGIAVMVGYDNGSSGNGFGFGLNGSALTGLFSGVAWVDSGYAFSSTSQWHQVVMLRQNGTLRFYVDGVQTANISAVVPLPPTAFQVGSQMGLRHYAGGIDEVRVYNRVLSVSEIQRLYVLENQGLPIISGQPQDQSVFVGQGASFSLSAFGTPSILSYQWTHQGSLLPGGTNSQWLIANSQPSDAGDYQCIVSNALGSVTSQVAKLTVQPIPLPAIVVQPVGLVNVLAGLDATLSVVATNPAPLSYQWFFADNPLAGATNASLWVGGVTPSQAGGYYVVVANLTGAVTSQVANVTVQLPPLPRILSQPVSAAVFLGRDVSLSITASNPVPLNYQWYFLDNPIAGATNPVLQLIRITAGQAGDYCAVVSNLGGAVTSQVAAVTVLIPATRYVDPGSSAPAAPYTNWASAAHSIQEAVDAAVAGDVVLVTNGIYDSGVRSVIGVASNRVVIDKEITVTSVNGPGVTFVVGAPQPNSNPTQGATRCVLLGSNAFLSGFTLTNGHADTLGDMDLARFERNGGGAYCEASAVISNCVIVNNQAVMGGGVYSGTVINCKLIGNTGFSYGGGASSSVCQNSLLSYNYAELGGGADSSTLYNCTVVRNVAYVGGGIRDSTLNNCICYYNTLCESFMASGTNYCGGSFTFTCTTPLPSGPRNLTNEPCFVDPTHGDFHLLSSSPCLDAGDNTVVQANWVDLDGSARIKGGRVDMGAFESDFLFSRTPVVQQKAGKSAGFELTVNGAEAHRWYRLQFKTNLAQPQWRSIDPWLPGNGSNLSLSDPAATNAFRFYRLESTNR